MLQNRQQYQQNLMLQKKELPTTPTKPNVTKEGIPTKIPTTPTKPNVTKEGIQQQQRYQQHRQNLMLQNKSYQQQQ